MYGVSEALPETEIGERLRLAALASYEIVDTAPELEFDALVRRAADRFATPISTISLIAADRQWFKARLGILARDTPREIAFCAHTIATGRPLIVSDALADERFATNPLVLDGPRIRFYAGAPLVTPLGRVIGTINVMDTQPRLPSAAKIATLVALAAEAMELLETRRSRSVRQRALAGANDNALAKTLGQH